eukprot:TRINITY_DN435_c2_g8_i1.p1 TRINITY_DN435_c2_g8~~TRINITY_DN435_c2_g8_i1.p1  ORF type:complete len:736 (+),score=259.95 TRINITY_DN435_c2_g8_i1:5902-8109(+)
MTPGNTGHAKSYRLRPGDAMHTCAAGRRKACACCSGHLQGAQQGQAGAGKQAGLGGQLGQVLGLAFKPHALTHQALALGGNIAPDQGWPGVDIVAAVLAGQQEQLLDAIDPYPPASDRTDQMPDIALLGHRQWQRGTLQQVGVERIGTLRHLRTRGGIGLGRQGGGMPGADQHEHRIKHLRQVQVAMRQRGGQVHQGMGLVVRECLQDGLVDQAVEGDLGGHVLDRQRHLVRFGQQHHALQRQCLDPLAVVQHLRATYPVVTPELLVDHEVAHALQQHRVVDLLDQLALRRRQVGHVQVIGIVRGTGELQARTRQLAMHVGKGFSMPVAIEVFVGQVAVALLLQELETVAHERVGLGIDRVGLEHARDEGQRGIDACGREQALLLVAGLLRVLYQQVTQGHEGRPARLGVVADVEHAPRLELAVDEIEDDGAVLLRHPAPDAMQGDEIEIRQVVAATEAREAGVLHLRTAAAGSRQFLGEGCLVRIEIVAPPAHGRGGGMEVGRQALAEAQLAGRLHRRRLQAVEGKGQRQARRIHARVVAIGIGDIDDVTVIPVDQGGLPRQGWALDEMSALAITVGLRLCSGQCGVFVRISARQVDRILAAIQLHLLQHGAAQVHAGMIGQLDQVDQHIGHLVPDALAGGVVEFGIGAGGQPLEMLHQLCHLHRQRHGQVLGRMEAQPVTFAGKNADQVAQFMEIGGGSRGRRRSSHGNGAMGSERQSGSHFITNPHRGWRQA